jgi:phenylacetic acid degradation operon negative regulatory protein
MSSCTAVDVAGSLPFTDPDLRPATMSSSGGLSAAPGLGMGEALVLEDIESRPGSTTSLLRTIIGLYIRRWQMRAPTSTFVELMTDLGVPHERTRTALARLKAKGLLLPDRSDGVGYRVNPEAQEMLRRGDRRIFSVSSRRMAASDPWCLVSYSISEELRDLRQKLRRRLQWIGCGTVAQGLWIGPLHLRGDVEDILDDLDLRAMATIFEARDPRAGVPMDRALAQWWDLDVLASEHRQFMAAVRALPLADAGPRSAFVRYVLLVDAWRTIPFLDPGLPAEYLPAGWPGRESIDLFLGESGRLADVAWLHAARAAKL